MDAETGNVLGAVAPVRERGLKCPVESTAGEYYSRSREGAWIEIQMLQEVLQLIASLP